MPTPKEHLDRLAKARLLLQADATSIEQLRKERGRRRDSFESCMSTLLDLMRDSKTPQVDRLRPPVPVAQQEARSRP